MVNQIDTHLDLLGSWVTTKEGHHVLVGPPCFISLIDPVDVTEGMGPLIWGITGRAEQILDLIDPLGSGVYLSGATKAGACKGISRIEDNNRGSVPRTSNLHLVNELILGNTRSTELTSQPIKGHRKEEAHTDINTQIEF